MAGVERTADVIKKPLMVKGTLPPSKKLMNWHESDVPWFRKSENEYLPNFTEKYSLVFKILGFYFCLLFGISPVTSDFIWKQ